MPNDTWYRIAAGSSSDNGFGDKDDDMMIRDYLNLESGGGGGGGGGGQQQTWLARLHERFSQGDERFRAISPYFTGARILRQPPVECLFCFICSQNNNIGRITGMVNRLCENYGTYIGELDDRKYYSFPTLEQIERATEEDLRRLGFGFRAKYIVGSARAIGELGGEDALIALRSASRSDAHAFLERLPGIGPKVASCVCLFALDKHDDIPVDTHVWQIANRDFQMGLKGKSLTKKIYAQIGDKFRDKFGEYAGWAHQIMFIADLREYAARLPEHLQPKNDEQ